MAAPRAHNALAALTFLAALGLGTFGLASAAEAHRFQRSYVDVRVAPEGAALIFDLDPDDFEAPLQSRFDDDGSGAVELGELTAHQDTLAALMHGGLRVGRGGEACALALRGRRVSSAALMVRVEMVAACPAAGALAVEAPLLEHLGRGHLLFLTVRHEGQVDSAVLALEHPRWSQKTPGGVGTFLWAGVEHIWMGYDHLLFLFALLTVARRWRELVAVVTAFTVAHSITLAMATLGVVTLSSRVTESSIALTIALAGALNLGGVRLPLVARWGLTFALGLVHGFGFASVLYDLGLPAEQRAGPLLAFNAGVELGQLAVVALAFPALARLRAGPLARRGVVLGASAVIAASVGLALFEPWGGALCVALGLGALAAAPRWGYERAVVLGGNAVVIALGLVWFGLRVSGE